MSDNVCFVFRSSFLIIDYIPRIKRTSYTPAIYYINANFKINTHPNIYLMDLFNGNSRIIALSNYQIIYCMLYLIVLF
jgi:hypothetical protein